MQLTLSVANARKLVEDLKDEHADTVLKFYDGDHWQDGEGWIGPFSESIRLGDTAAAALVRAGFVSRDVIKEGIDRHIEGVVGREPAWYATPARGISEDEPLTDEEGERIAELEGALVEWWDKRNVLDLLQNAALKLVATERSVVRLFVPVGRRKPTGTGLGIPVPTGKPAERLQQALEYLFPAVGDLDSAGVFLDLDTMEQYGIYLYTDKKNKKTFAEIVYPRDDLTVMEVRNSDERKLTPTEVYEFPWNGRLPLYQMTRKELVTKSALSQQRKLNLAETMEARNIVTAGSPERWLFNASPPGEWVDDPANPGRKKFVPTAFNVGGGVTNSLVGITIEEQDENGATRRTITEPRLERLDPASVEIFESVSNRAIASILSEIKQRHVLMSGDGSASAVSRVQARADYLNSLLLTKTEIDGLIRWMLETLLTMASHFAGLGDRYADLRIYASAKLDTGPLTPDEQRVVIERYQAGTLTRESAMHLLGVEDVDAEAARLKLEEQDSLVVQKARADIAGTLVQQAGASLRGAMKVAGYATAEINAALKVDKERMEMAAAIAGGDVPGGDQEEEEPATESEQDQEQPEEEDTEEEQE